jgi:hypothetical protein
MSTDYADLTTKDIAKQINDEYSVILANEKANLPRALAIGEKLMWLRARVIHGEWQTKLKEYCPKISYETATLYIRLFERQMDWRAAAAGKGVEPTDLTIDEARKLLAKPKAADDDDDDGKPTVEAMIAKQTANAEAEAAALEDVDLDAARRQRVDKTVEVLMRTYPQDELLDLTEKLAKHLGMTLMPLATTEALMRELGAPTAPVA